MAAAPMSYQDDDSSDDGELSVVEPTGISSGKAKQAPSTVEKAQRALMSSLQMPRKSYKNLDRDYGAQAEVVATDGRIIKAHHLHTLRADHRLEERRSDIAAADAVKSLSHDHTQPPVVSLKGGEGIREMQARRKSRHDDAVRDWHVKQREFYDSAEDLVLEAGRSLRADLVAIDDGVDAVLDKLEDGSDAIGRDHPHVLAVWDQVAALEAERAQRVGTFRGYLEGLEDRRCDELGSELQALTRVLCDIGHALPAAVERIVSREATEINRLAARNRVDAVDVASKLASTATLSRVRNRQRWERAEAAWRVLRHEDAIQKLLNRLTSAEFVDPPARLEAARQLRELQRQVHEHQRLPALRRLVKMRPPTLTEAEVTAARQNLEAVAEAEAEAEATGFGLVRAAQSQCDDAAEEERETLRAVLHEFAALSPPSNLAVLAKTMQSDLLEAQELQDLWRKASGLRNEVALLTTRCGSPEVMYAMHLQAATERAELLAASLGLGQAAETQGKGADREALASTVDKMRTAKRTNLPGLVARLQTQTVRLSTLEGLPEVVAEELSSCAESLGELCEQCYTALVDNRLEVPALLRSVVTGEGGAAAAAAATGDGGSSGGRGGGAGAASVLMRGGAGGGAASVARRSGSRGSVGRRTARTGSVGRRSTGSGAGKTARTGKSGKSKRSRGSAGAGGTFVDDARSTVIGQALPMAELRALQRRVGALAVACELPEDAAALLREVLAGLHRQAAANTAVDAAISDMVDPVIRQRKTEGEGLCGRIAAALERQSRSLESAAVNVCRMWSRLARAELRHQTRERAIDERAADDLNGALDAFEEQNEHLEREVGRTRKLCREAPDEDELTTRFTDVLGALDAVESGYRDYTAQAVGVSEKLPVSGRGNTRRHRRALCELFGIRLIDAEAVDGVPSTPAAEAQAGEPTEAAGSADAASAAEAAPGDASAAVAAVTAPIAAEQPPLGAKVLAAARYQSDDGISPRSPRPAGADEDALLAEAEAPTPSCSAVEAEANGWAQLVITPRTRVRVAGVSPGKPESKTSEDAGSRAYAQEVDAAALAGALVTTLRETEAEMQQRNRMEEEQEAHAAVEAAQGEEEAKRRAEEDATAAAGAAAAGGKKKAPAKKPKKDAKAGKKGGKGAAAEEAEPKHPRPANEEEEAEWEAAAQVAMAAEDEAGYAAREQEAAARVYERGMEDAFGMPLAPGGEVLVLHCHVEPEEATDWMASIRQDLLEAFEAHSRARLAELAEQRNDRVALFTAELAERVRRHWPRKSAAETEVRAPRQAELLAHAQKLERHCRAWRERQVRQQDAFEREVAEARAHTVAFAEQLRVLQESLPAQASLATLQGQQNRAKALLVAYDTEAEGWRRRLAAYASQEPRKLTGLNREFLRTCDRFAEGGEYDDSEVEDISHVLAELDAGLQGDVDGRTETNSQVGQEQRDAAAAIGPFDEAFHEALRALSMREGLGKQFGAPRRQCTERLRTVLGWSDTEERRIVARLNELEGLLTEGSGRVEDLRGREKRAAELAELARRSGGEDTTCDKVDAAVAAAEAAAAEAEAVAVAGGGVSAILSRDAVDAALAMTTAPPSLPKSSGASELGSSSAELPAMLILRVTSARGGKRSSSGLPRPEGPILARTAWADGEDAEEEEATVRLMVLGRSLAEARAEATSHVRRMRKQARAAQGEGDGDSTEDEGDDQDEDGGAASGNAAATGAAASTASDIGVPIALDGVLPLDRVQPLYQTTAGASLGGAAKSVRFGEGGSASASATGATARQGDTLSLSARIRYSMLVLRELIERRSRYIEALKPDCRALSACDRLDLSDEPCAPDVAFPQPGSAAAERHRRRRKARKPSGIDEAAASTEEAAASSTRLSVQIEEALQLCRHSTRELFEAEGEPLEAGDAGLPQSLRDYLEREEERCEGARLAACRRLRELVGRAWRLLSEAPAAAVVDSVTRSARYGDDVAAWSRRRFRASVRALVAARESHASKLGPKLGDPNNAKELHELDQAEHRRCEEHRQVVASARARELVCRRIAGQTMRRRMLHCARWCLQVTDAMVMAEDLAALPGDADAAPTKLGLRRLRKQLRRDEAEAANAKAEADAAAEGVAAGAGGGKGGKKKAPAKKPKKDAKAGKKGGKGAAAGAGVGEEEAEDEAMLETQRGLVKTLSGPAGLLPEAAGAGMLEDGAGVPTRAYKRRRWSGLAPPPWELLALPQLGEEGAWAAAAQSSTLRGLKQLIERLGAADDVAQQAAQSTDAEAPEEEGDEEDDADLGMTSGKAVRKRLAAVEDVLVGIYSESSRHTVRTRDAAWRTAAGATLAVVRATSRWYAGLHASVGRWQDHWESLTASLRLEAAHLQGEDAETKE